MKKINYYYIIGSQKFLLQQEPLEEVLRERTKNYNKRKRCLDFWVLLNPKFLFSVKSKKIKEKCNDSRICLNLSKCRTVHFLRTKSCNPMSVMIVSATKDFKEKFMVFLIKTTDNSRIL